MVRDCPACDEIRAVELAAIFSGRSASSFEATQAAVSDIDADLGEVLRRDGIELVLGARATSARRDGEDYVLELDERPRAGGRIN